RDIGCLDWRSIVETSRGFMFPSARGFYLLPRGNGAPVFIGAAVQERFSASEYPETLGAAAYACSEHRTVRWLVRSGNDTPVVVYDLDASESDPNQGWSYDTHSSQLAAIGRWPSGLALMQASFSSSSRIGYLEQLTPVYTGDGSNSQAITSAIETADIRSAGPAGYFKLMSATALLSEPDGGTLTITITTDGSSLVTPFAMTSQSGSVYRHVAPANVNCTAAQVRLSCVRTTATRGPTFHALTLEQTPIAGGRRTTTAERT
ncbi:MAG TPA: hypothetical protein VER33_20830, partial [Polyangiaceae bacterium]|nr:hypothetical protein [Polyangiaceae bacterium]